MVHPNELTACGIELRLGVDDSAVEDDDIVFVRGC
jgi:hypothetical protein